MFFAKTAIIAASVALVNGHMVMYSPAPWDVVHGTTHSLSNSPLDASGSDFPCKFGPAYTATGGSVNQYELGSKQLLGFTGSAVHGGGSCQVVMTYDQPPTKDSKWKVIHSIEGGCPARGQSQNLPENAEAKDPYTYDYSIPSDIPAGKGTIAFTWFNRIGNREMYMNCGPLELTGTGGDKANFDSLPDMVILNIGDHPKTPEGVDYKYENPGKSVENNIGQFGVATCGNDGCKAGDSGSSGSDSGSGSAPSSSQAATPTTTAAAGGNGGGVFLTQPGTTLATSTVAPTTTTAAAATTTASAPTTTAVPASTPTSVPSSGGSSGALSGACTTEGMWNCIGGTSFQQCASGLWSVAMPVAAGTTCEAGEGSTIKIAAAKGRRAARAFRA